MIEHRFWWEAGLVLLALAVAGLAFGALRQSVLPAFLLLGLLAQPWTRDSELVDVLGSFGVLLLLFFLGLEFSVARLARDPRGLLRVGLWNLLLMFPIAGLAGAIAAGDRLSAVLVALGVVPTSSAIVAKSIVELRRAADPETEVALRILVVEDIAVALLLGVASAAVVGGSVSVQATAVNVALASAFLLVGFLGGWFGRSIVERIFRIGHDDVFVLAVAAAVLLGAAAATTVGLSDAIGAFLVGSIVGETAHRDRAKRLFAPLQGLFAALFFFSFGREIDLRTAAQVAGPAFVVTFLASVAKVAVGWWAGRQAGLGPRARVHLGLLLVPRGEFTVVAAHLAAASGRERAAAVLAWVVVVLGTIGTIGIQLGPTLSARLFPPRRARGPGAAPPVRDAAPDDTSLG